MKPGVHLRNQSAHAFLVLTHELIEFSEFTGAKEDSGHTKFKIDVIETESVEETLKASPVKAGSVQRRENKLCKTALDQVF